MPISIGGDFGVPLRGRDGGSALGRDSFPLSLNFFRRFELLG